MAALAESLCRTLLLIRDEVGPDVDDRILLDALTGARIALIADATNIASPAAQTAFVTAAILMARSGHQVFLIAPDIVIAAPQPPLQSGLLIAQLLVIGKDLLPGVEFAAEMPDGEVDLAVALGDAPFIVPARRRIRINASAWAGILLAEIRPQPWREKSWPFGALAAGGLAAGEAFKVVMQKLLPHATNPENTTARFANVDDITFELAPDATSYCRDLEAIDCVSGGAITNAVLYCLARIPSVTGHGRIIEPETAELSNLNRYMLLLRSGCDASKADGLAKALRGGLDFRAIPERYEPAIAGSLAPLAPTVVVGVDHIPTRWTVQQAMPEWLVVGATTHWSAMASFHSAGLACAHCLHNVDDPDDRLIPTTACVSFWSGLLTAAYIARRAAGQMISASEQQIYLTPFRPETPFISAVRLRENCPTCRPFRLNARDKALVD